MINKTKNIINIEDKKRLLSNFFSLSVLQIFTYILPLLTLPYLVRVLEVDKFGLVMFAQSFIIFFNIFVDFGFNLSATRDVSINRDNKEKLTEIFSSVMIIKLLLIILSLIVLCGIVFLFDKFSKDWDLYFLTFLWVVGQALFPIWYFQGIEKMKYITIVNILSKVIFTLAIFIFIQEESDYILVPILNGLGFIIGGLYSLWIIRKDMAQEFKLQRLSTLFYYFKDSSEFFLSRVSLVLYTSANIFILGLFTNTTMVGYYSIAEKLYQALQGLYSPITQILYPYIAKYKNISLFRKVFFFAILINACGLVFLYFLGENLFALLFTQKIGQESIQVFNVFLLVAVFVVPSILLGYPLLGALGFSNYANKSVIYGSIIHIIGLSFLSICNLITIYNVAFMVLFTEVLVLSLRVFWVKRSNLL